jgi:hypothetical protein
MNLPEFKFERKHSRDIFYKYTTANAAKLILSNGTFRYSCPLLFNDPFDCQAGLHLDFNKDTFVSMFLDRVEELVISDSPPTFASFNRYSEATLMMREKYPTHGFPKKRVLEKMGPIVQLIADKIIETHKAMRNNWEISFKRMRLFCFSELFDNILMWSHYSDYHRGVVLAMKVAETAEEDDPLWIAQPVKYIKKSTPLFSQNHIDEILGIIPSKYKSLFDVYAYAKYDVWEYEREWRVFDLTDTPDENQYEDNRFNFNKIAAIYFGCRCDERDINEIASIVKSRKKDVRLFKAFKHDYDFKLEFKDL